MTHEALIRPANPGEVLACAGLAVLAALDEPNARTGFEGTDDPATYRFQFPANVLERLEPAALAVDATEDALTVAGVTLDWWRPWRVNPPMKLWAGQQSASSVLSNLARSASRGTAEKWLDFQDRTTGRLGVDPLGSWDSLGLGWSINEHPEHQMLCRPFVELLAFIGLQAFPLRGTKMDGFRYALWEPAPLLIARLAFMGSSRLMLGGWHTPTDKSGSNTFLLPATEL